MIKIKTFEKITPEITKKIICENILYKVVSCEAVYNSFEITHFELTLETIK